MNNIQNYGISFMANPKTSEIPLAKGLEQFKKLIDKGAKEVKPDLYVLSDENGIIYARNFNAYLPRLEQYVKKTSK